MKCLFSKRDRATREIFRSRSGRTVSRLALPFLVTDGMKWHSKATYKSWEKKEQQEIQMEDEIR